MIQNPDSIVMARLLTVKGVEPKHDLTSLHALGTAVKAVAEQVYVTAVCGPDLRCKSL